MLNWKAVALGAIVDFVGTYLASLALVGLWIGAAYLGESGGGAASDEATKTLAHDHLFLAVCMTVGWYFDYLGGKVAGTIAGRQKLLHGLAAAIPGVVLALIDTFTPSDDDFFPPWFMVLACCISIGCAVYGGSKAVDLKKITEKP